MKTFKIIAILMIGILLIAGCSKNKQVKGHKDVYQPDWYNLQSSPEYVQTYGMATKVNQNSSFDAARANAMLQAAQHVETYVKGMVKNYEEEAGVVDPTVTALTSKVVKEISNAKFTNVLVTKQKTIELDNGRFQTFVRVSIPKETVNKNLMDKIKNEEALYNQFKASQAFDELEKEIDKY